MSNATGHDDARSAADPFRPARGGMAIALDTLFRAQQRQPSRMDEERRAYLEQERLLQRQQANKPTVLARVRITPVAQSR